MTPRFRASSRALLGLLLLLSLPPRPVSAQLWNTSPAGELVLPHLQLGIDTTATLLPFHLDLRTPEAEVLEVVHAWGWTWFIPLRLPSAGYRLCRDLPVVYFEHLPPEAYQVEDVNGDGLSDLIVRLQSDQTTRVRFGAGGWRDCRRPGEGGQP